MSNVDVEPAGDANKPRNRSVMEHVRKETRVDDMAAPPPMNWPGSARGALVASDSTWRDARRWGAPGTLIVLACHCSTALSALRGRLLPSRILAGNGEFRGSGGTVGSTVLNLLLRLRGVRLEAHPVHARTLIVQEHGDRVGEITFSAYERQHTGRGWRISEPAGGVGPRYRSRWGATWALIRRSDH